MKCANCTNWFLGNCERLDEIKDPLDDACRHHFPVRYVKVDVSGTGWEYEIKDTKTGEMLGVNQAIHELNLMNRKVTELELKGREPVNCQCSFGDSPPDLDYGIKLDLEPYSIPLKVNPELDVEKLKEVLAKTVQYRCPDCKTELIYDYETENYEFFYCPTCLKRVKAKKGWIENERSY